MRVMDKNYYVVALPSQFAKIPSKNNNGESSLPQSPEHKFKLNGEPQHYSMLGLFGDIT